MLVLLAKLGRFWRSLDKKVTVSKRELFLGLTTCSLAGVVIGYWTAPKKQNYFGSQNCNNEYKGDVTLSDLEEGEANKAPKEKHTGKK